MAGLCQPLPTQTGLEVGSDRRQRVHSASCTMTMAWISASWWYSLSTPSAVGGGKVFKGLAMAASVWAPSRLAEGVTPLGSSMGGGKVYHQEDLLHLECRLRPQRLVWLGHDNCLHVDELAPSLCHFLLGAGLPSMSMHLWPLLRSALSLKGVVGVRPRHQRPR
jgi:hypothetical protein